MAQSPSIFGFAKNLAVVQFIAGKGKGLLIENRRVYPTFYPQYPTFPWDYNKLSHIERV